jgi:hypothetical protein
MHILLFRQRSFLVDGVWRKIKPMKKLLTVGLMTMLAGLEQSTAQV